MADALAPVRTQCLRQRLGLAAHRRQPALGRIALEPSGAARQADEDRGGSLDIAGLASDLPTGIVDERTVGARKEYLVRWVGYAPQYDSWVAEQDMLGAKSLLAEFRQRRRARKP